MFNPKQYQHVINAGTPAMQQLRQQAMDLCKTEGWPDRKQEAWKYTPTGALQKHALDLDTQAEITFTAPAAASIRIEKISEKNFHSYESFFSANKEDSALVLLNHALWQNAWVIHVTKNASIQQSLQVTFPTLQTATSQYCKLIFILEEGANLPVIMTHQPSAGLCNVMIHTDLAAHAQITFLDCADAGEAAMHFIQHTTTLHSHSIFNHYALALQAKWLRHELTVHFNEPHAQCHLNGLYFAVAEQLVDHHLCVNHTAPHCHSSQFYKGVLADAAHGVFNGKVIVAKQAEKTVSSQKNHNILLSNRAEIDTKPELQIYADDVLCSHGATVGALSDEALFYLTARGIAPNQAKQILLEAFMQTIAVECAPFEEYIKKLVTKRLTKVQWG